MTNKLLLKPYITEKSSNFLTLNKFIFISNIKYNKIEVKKYIFSEFKISVNDVNILKKFGKKKRRGKVNYTESNLFKYIITINSDENVDKLKELF